MPFITNPWPTSRAGTSSRGARRRGRADLSAWTEGLAQDLRALGVRTYPTETYFFLADFASSDATGLAERLREQQILVKPLGDRRLGRGFMRVTTARPEDNGRFVQALRALL
jgi:histidinol-phosphate aminotransferase